MDLLRELFDRMQFVSFFRAVDRTGEETEEYCLHVTNHLGERSVVVRRSPEEMVRAALGVELTKRCRNCGLDKRLSEYSRSRSYRDGYLYRCKSCERKRVRAYHRKQRDERDCQGNELRQ
jgi:hypothetical protein